MISHSEDKKITESAIELLEKHGYNYLFGPDIAPALPASAGQAGSENPARQSFEEIILLGSLKASVARINAKITADAREYAIKQIQRLATPELIANNNCLFIGGVMLAAYL